MQTNPVRSSRYGVIALFSLFGLFGLFGALQSPGSEDGLIVLIFLGGCFVFVLEQIRGLFERHDHGPLIDVLPKTVAASWVLLAAFSLLFLFALVLAAGWSPGAERIGFALMVTSTIGGFWALKRGFDLAH